MAVGRAAPRGGAIVVCWCWCGAAPGRGGGGEPPLPPAWAHAPGSVCDSSGPVGGRPRAEWGEVGLRRACGPGRASGGSGMRHSFDPPTSARPAERLVLLLPPIAGPDGMRNPAIRPERRLRLSEFRADWDAPADPRRGRRPALSRRRTLRLRSVWFVFRSGGLRGEGRAEGGAGLTPAAAGCCCSGAASPAAASCPSIQL